MVGGVIVIGKYCNLKFLNVYMEDSNNELFVGDYVSVNAFKRHEVRLHIVEGSKIQIGNNCLFSNSIQMHTSDFHSILDYSDNRINHAMPIILNNNVWIGFGSTILKGVSIGSNSVVGANSNVPRGSYSDNSIIGGNPAKIIKTNIQWKKERV